MRNTPTLSSILADTLEARLADLHGPLPARVEKFDAARGCVDVQPLIRVGRTDSESGDRVVERLPVITQVPVVFPGSGEYGQVWPVSRGDIGLIITCEHSIDKWLTRGGEVDPLDDRRFNLSDAVFLPGLRSLNASFPAAPDGALVLRTKSEIHLGGDDGIEVTFKAETFMNALNNLITGITAYVANFATPNPGTSGPAATAWGTAVTAFATAIAAGAKTTVVKVK